MIEIRGHKIPSVVVSTIFGHAGNGMFPLYFLPSYRKVLQLARETNTAIITKSSTRNPKIDNYRNYQPWTWKNVQRLPGDGLLNAYGLTNDGIGVNAPKINRSIEKGYNVIPNIYPEFSHGTEKALEETLRSVTILHDFLDENFWALEVSYSCPNSKEDISKNMEQANLCTARIKKFYPWLVLIIKVSIIHPYEFAEEQIRQGADVIHAVNAIPYNWLFPSQISPLYKVGGGAVSGRPSARKAFIYNYGLTKRINANIIFGNGIMSVDDTKRCFDVGADAINLCTVVRLNPVEAEKIIKKYNF